MWEAASRLADALREVGDGLVLVVTGAGVSHASGIATFRGADPEAVWRRSDMEMATISYFESDPVGQWAWYLKRFQALDAAQPNPAHRALAALERWQEQRGSYLLVTQNIDCLHERAGSRSMIKVHGSSDRVRCVSYDCPNGAPAGSLPRSQFDLEALTATSNSESLPRCPHCSELVRAHVLFFDEYYGEHRDYRFHEVEAAAQEAALVIFAGTSFSVGVTDAVLRAAAQRRAPVFSIDPAAARQISRLPLEPLAVAAETLLPAVCEELGAPLENDPP